MRAAIVALLGVCAATATIGAAWAAGPFGDPYKGPQACHLLTAALAKSVIGKDAHLTRSTKPNAFETTCQYNSSTAFVTVEAGNWAWLKPFPGEGTKVARLGDEAWISSLELVVRKGDRAIKVDVAIVGTFNGSAAASVTAREQALEKQLAAKLLKSL